MTAEQILILAAMMGSLGWMGTTLVITAFCSQPMPKWLFMIVAISNAGFFLRIAAAKLGDFPLDNRSASIYLASSLVSLIVFIYHLWHVRGPHGDRCPPKAVR